jgi:hypothetical protein
VDSIGGEIGSDGRGVAVGKGIRQDSNSNDVNINFNEPPRNSTQPPTVAQNVNELVEKVNRLLVLIEGDPRYDVYGMRPRLRDVEREVKILRWLVGALVVAEVILRGLHW